MNCIDRGEAMNLLNEAQVEYDENYKGLGLAKKIISDMKPTIPERPKGKWVLTQRGKHVDITCSCCGSIGVESYAYNYSVDDLSEYEAREYTEKSRMYFCKVCGADMRGE